MANIGKTPQNQLDALPLQDADTAAAGGVVQFVGTTLVRYFDAAALGINASSVATVNTKVCIVTPYLDLRGCKQYNFTLRCTNAAVRIALPACFLEAQMRMGSADTPSASYVNGGAIANTLNAIMQINAAGQTFAATTAGGEVQTVLWSWDSSSGSGNSGAWFSSDVRFIVSFSTNPVVAGTVFTANLWAQS